jgi:predicted MFS family arabinose efflux permease
MPVDVAKSPGLAVTQGEDGSSVKGVVVAASIGTVFEWYDFVLYGSMAPVIASKFFAGVDPTTGFVFALLTFAVGFVMRPVGALIFGRIGDQVGRKKTFLITIVLMGLSTIGVGLLPTYNSVGLAAPILLVMLRMSQGMALGGEYGGAITYVAEHSPANKRGFNTSWIAATGTIGLLMSFLVILAMRWLTGDRFDIWGWRLPFLVSVLLLIVSVKIRLQMQESPAFEKLRNQRGLSKAPLSEAFLHWQNLRQVLIAFFLCAGMTSVYYIATLYPVFFLVQTLKVDPQIVNLMAAYSTVVCAPLFIVVGSLCDRIGRKPVLVVAYVVTAVALFPVFHGFTRAANPALEQAEIRTPVLLEADSVDCSFMFNPTGTAKFTTPCDVARRALSGMGVNYKTQQTPNAAGVAVRIGTESVVLGVAADASAAERQAQNTTFESALRNKLLQLGYPDRPDSAKVNSLAIFGLMLILLVCAVSVVTPIALVLVEIFPTRIRYTAMSAPYHFATGWVGGLLPTVVFAVSAQEGNMYAGLWYPVGWIIAAAIVCLLFYRETRNVDLSAVN